MGKSVCINIAGKRFGRLIVIKRAEHTGKRAHWLCRCDCGNEVVVSGTNLRNGNTSSCGCYSKLQRLKGSGCVQGTKVCQLSSKLHRNNPTGVRGVTYYKPLSKYRAGIAFKGNAYHLGYYDTLEEAKTVRQKAEKEIWGDFLEWYNANYKTKKDNI